ncbi:MAG: hypothetical protein AAGJ96_11220, partial [Pseudomonadota bacterium]
AQAVSSKAASRATEGPAFAVSTSGFAHAGSNTLWYATAFVWPELDATLVLTANAGPSVALEAAFEETAWALQTAVVGGAGLSAFDAVP